MESVTLVLSGTLLALQYIGTRDKYLLAFIVGLGSYHDSELDIFFDFFHEATCSFIVYKYYELDSFRIQHKIFDRLFRSNDKDPIKRQRLGDNKEHFIRSFL